MMLVKRKSIMFQVMAPSLSLIVLAFLVVGGFIAWSRSGHTLNAYRRRVELTSSLSQESAANGLWLVDEGVLRNALTPILHDPDRRFVLVEDVQGKTFFASGEPGLRSAALKVANDAPRTGGLRIIKQGRYLFSIVPLQHAEAGEVIPLGEMVIVYDTHSAMASVWSTMLLAAGLVAISLGVIVLALVTLLRRITGPLNDLSLAMRTLSDGQLETEVSGLDRKDEIGAMARSVQVFKDNALKLKASERESARLYEAQLRAEASNHAKREFLAHMSHELRTPLNGVLTMADLMARGELKTDQRAKLDIIRRSGQDLLHVINDVLDFSKIEAGKLELESTAFDVEQALENTRASFAAVAQRKGLTLSLDIAADARGLRRGDPARLRQIVNNYVSNAVKFTAKGGVSIVVRGRGEAGRDGLTISVRDTGPGISREKLPLLFQKFSQVDASTTRQFGGTGLGLAICQELASLMGGRAWVESEPGVGTTFYASVDLPYLGAATGPVADDVEGGGRGAGGVLRVLAAEDNATNQVVLSTIMDAFGFELRVASNGREAVETWSQGGFDLILMDVQMPEMDGLEATRAIRAIEAARGLPRTPIIALTANAFRHQIDAYAAAGMDDHLAKPIEITLLQAVLERVLSRREAAA